MRQIKNYQELLLPYSITILNSYDDALDVIQDVITSFITKDKTKIKNPKNYLIKSTINRSISLKKKLGKTVIKPDENFYDIESSYKSPDWNLIVENDFINSNLKYLNKLDMKSTAIYILKYGFNYSHNEISELLGIDPVNSRKKLSRLNSEIKTKKTSNQKETFTKTLLKKIKKRNMEELEKFLMSLN
ncbi:RNA polymerase sigma factor [Abyssalbus ytuae]|uniref:Sigma-70 family RNA polymerase sigma factor n=1 Tax=Abyssalbus ytuae TaxID=2926907 RepID=A0A9E7CY13_9FLAO|nr:sigma-70 family RNA polymerase sigma factor [Abyssalbus ytuae]UOB16150.1 sigma-70 family RNA polymerase sigma factor [Abyssalbus ytuae]